RRSLQSCNAPFLAIYVDPSDRVWMRSFFFFFNHPATTEIYTFSLPDALPICFNTVSAQQLASNYQSFPPLLTGSFGSYRSEAHTSELQSLTNLVCRLLPE